MTRKLTANRRRSRHQRSNQSIDGDDDESYSTIRSGRQESQISDYSRRRSKNRKSSRGSKYQRHSKKSRNNKESNSRTRRRPPQPMKPIRLFSDSSDGELSAKELNFETETEYGNVTGETVQTPIAQNYGSNPENKGVNGFKIEENKKTGTRTVTDVIKDSGVTTQIKLISKKTPSNSTKNRFLPREVQIKFLEENSRHSGSSTYGNESDDSNIDSMWKLSNFVRQGIKENFLFTPSIQNSTNSESTLRPPLEEGSTTIQGSNLSLSSAQDIGIREVGSPADKTCENVESLTAEPASPRLDNNRTLTEKNKSTSLKSPQKLKQTPKVENPKACSTPIKAFFTEMMEKVVELPTSGLFRSRSENILGYSGKNDRKKISKSVSLVPGMEKPSPVKASSVSLNVDSTASDIECNIYKKTTIPDTKNNKPGEKHSHQKKICVNFIANGIPASINMYLTIETDSPVLSFEAVELAVDDEKIWRHSARIAEIRHKEKSGQHD